MAKHITPQELSLYYDGLLDGARAQEVARQLEADPDARRMMESFALFDDAIQPDLSDEEIDALVSDTVQQVHQRLAQPVRRESSSWSWLLAPRFMMAACVVLALFSVVMVPQFQTAPNNVIEQNPDTNGNGGKGEEKGAPTDEMDPLQKQAFVAVASYAGKTISSGVNAVSERSGAIAETYQAIENKSEASVALSAIREGISSLRSSEDKTVASAEKSESVNQLEELKRRQAMIGLGASLFSFVSMI
ncbi:hypothetical protein K8I31_16100 [bacterium]|nr:hypothetical protein [bacterium]